MTSCETVLFYVIYWNHYKKRLYWCVRQYDLAAKHVMKIYVVVLTFIILWTLLQLCLEAHSVCLFDLKETRTLSTECNVYENSTG